jgi:hypothetical protein
MTQLSEHVKALIVYVFYGLLIALLAWVGFITAKYSTKIGSSVGSLIGGLIGLGLSIFLWIWVGRKFVETTTP